MFKTKNTFKSQKNYYTLFFLLSAIFTFTNCEKEDFSEYNTEKENGNNSIFKTGNLMDFPDLENFIENENLNLNNNTPDGFTLIKKNINKITNLNNTTYTLKIIKNNQEIGSFSNLVVELSNNKTSAKIINYYPSIDYITEFKTNKQAMFSGSFSLQNIESINNLYTNQTSRGCITVITTYCNYGGENHAVGPNCTPSYIHTNHQTLCSEEPQEYIISEDEDENYNSGGGGNSLTNPNPPTECDIIELSNIPISEFNTCDDDEIYLNIEDNIQFIISCINPLAINSDNTLLSDEMIQWLQSQPKSVVKQIRDYLENNTCNVGAQSFVVDAIETLSLGGVVDFEELFIETPTPDDQYIYNGPKSHISNPLILENGNEIIINFGTTSSDNQNANQEISTILISALKQALQAANNNLNQNEKIESIYIMATSNGTHGPGSNHGNGTALDISRINGVKMAVSGVTNQISELQIAFDNYIYIRENFGPYFKHKFYSSNGTWNYNYPVAGHNDHIHVSVR